MQLNLPILHLLHERQSILIAGAGGGFDVYAGLPLYFALRALGKTVHLANLSFMDFGLAKIVSDPLEVIPTLLLGARPPIRYPIAYFPEGYLAEWFAQQDEEIIIWMFGRTGVIGLAQAYAHLTQQLGTDALILVDGGVDSLMRGDETAPGTLIEDSISLAAVENLPLPVKILACIGFGTEVEEGVCHHHALENMAALIKAGAFYGSCALTPAMLAFQRYEAACRHAWERLPDAHTSHISTRIIPAVQGEFGNYQMYRRQGSHPSFISILMGLYWFFDAQQVLAHNALAHALRDTITAEQARSIGMNFYRDNRKRPVRPIPY